MTPWMRMTLRLFVGGKVRRRRANPLLGLYRWRYEIVLLGMVAALVWLGRTTSWVAPLGVVLTVGAVLAIWPSARRVVGQRCRSVVVQHRLRSTFHELCLTTWVGRSPAMLWTTPRRDAVRVHLLCPAGIAAWHFMPRSSTPWRRRATCLPCGVEPSPRHSALLVLVVVTHLPVGGRPGGGET